MPLLPTVDIESLPSFFLPSLTQHPSNVCDLCTSRLVVSILQPRSVERNHPVVAKPQRTLPAVS